MSMSKEAININRMLPTKVMKSNFGKWLMKVLARTQKAPAGPYIHKALREHSEVLPLSGALSLTPIPANLVTAGSMPLYVGIKKTIQQLLGGKGLSSLGALGNEYKALAKAYQQVPLGEQHILPLAQVGAGVALGLGIRHKLRNDEYENRELRELIKVLHKIRYL